MSYYDPPRERQGPAEAYPNHGHPYRQNPTENRQPTGHREHYPLPSRGSAGVGARGPGAHPDSAYRPRDAARGYGVPAGGGGLTGVAAAHSMVTPGVDNFGDAAAGGMAGIASRVAERNARESGMQAMDGPRRTQQQPSYPQQAYAHGQNHQDLNGSQQARAFQQQQQQQQHQDPFATESDSYSSLHSAPTPTRTPGRNSPHGNPSPYEPAYGVYSDDPYGDLGRSSQPDLGYVNPRDIVDDGDDGLGYPRTRRRSWLQSAGGATGAAGAVGGSIAAAAAALRGGGGGGVGGAGGGGPGVDGNGEYGPANADTAYAGAAGTATGRGMPGEKSTWPTEAERQGRRNKTVKWIIIVVIILAIIGAVIGSLYGTGVFGNAGGDGGGGGGGGGGGQSAADDARQNGDLDRNSGEIRALLGNRNLHKVFPGMDYTPLNSQYPECIGNPPSQNNVTRDMAVLGQLTNEVRLYGTDCNQTQMVLHAIDQLGLRGTMKVWLGVWQDGNDTTNARQLEQMWDILDQYGAEPFAGLIVANEILFREQMTETQLGNLLDSVRQNLTANGMSLTVSTSDLGDDWNASINSTSDLVMANIHPFFAGKPVDEAAAWTMKFWTDSDGRWFRDDLSMNVIAETGWPTGGGTSCGSALVSKCDRGSVAGIDELNQFMGDWVCQALADGTRYFWFSAFDEPWKIAYNEPGKEWEDKWGLLDVNRNLKDGVKIPDCGGKTV